MADHNEGRIAFTFIQAKRSESYDYGDMSKFFDAVFGFFTGGMDGESEQLDDLIAAKDTVFKSALRKNPDLFCYFTSTGKYEKVDRIDKLIVKQPGLKDISLFDRVHIEIIGAENCKWHIAARPPAPTPGKSNLVKTRQCELIRTLIKPL